METLDSLLVKVEKAKATLPVEAKYPTDIIIDLSGPEGNIFYIMGICRQLGKRFDIPDDEMQQYTKSCQNSYYKKILEISQEWFGLIYINENIGI